MAKKLLLKNAADFVGEEAIIYGWVFNKRSSGAIIFLQVRDGSGFIQATVLKNEVASSVFNKAKELTLESAVSFSGLVRQEKRATSGLEINIKDLQIISQADKDYPIGKKAHGPDFLLSHRHLWLRSKRQWAIFKIRNEVINSINDFLQKEKFIRIDSPIITPSSCEGTTNLFEIDYFGEKAYLSQSGQLYLEAAIFSFGRCYDFNPALRAEKSKTRRHLIEFWMMDAEAAFVDFDSILKIEERLIYFLIQRVIQRCSLELQIIERDISPLKKIKLPFLRLTYKQAIDKLQELRSDISYGTDFGNDDETILMNHYQQPLFVTHYPAQIKAFYCQKDKIDETLSLSADLFAPEGYGEIIGGGEREDDYDKLLKSIKHCGFSLKDYQWYLDLRKYGSVPHSGFGLGLERLVAWIGKLEHVRESIPFPRMLDRFRP